jgi:hypothetical protein
MGFKGLQNTGDRFRIPLLMGALFFQGEGEKYLISPYILSGYHYG